MKLYVLFAQRKQRYPGEYGPEALACMTEYDHESNPAYLEEEQHKAEATGEFQSVELVALNVDGHKIDQLLSTVVAEMPATIGE